MPYFVVRSEREEWFQVRVADCTRAHAETVMATLHADPHVPSDLKLEQTDKHFGDQPKRRRFRRNGG